MKRTAESVDVCIDWTEAGGLRRMGHLHWQPGKGGGVVAFEYDRTWLQEWRGLPLDPDLALVPGRTYPRPERGDFGVFLDSAPDRWGRTLMQRRENWRARQENRPAQVLTDWDYLLGVHDLTRLGALRFRRGPTDPFLADDQGLAVPPLANVRELAAAVALIEADDGISHPDEEGRWLQQLCAPGSSLGGARPKAVVRDDEGHLCLAKLPSRNDQADVGAWEFVTNRLARRAGITVPDARLLRWGPTGSTVLFRRFDRDVRGNRLPFVSAMTLLGRRDGQPGASYLEVAELLMRDGAQRKVDAVQWFRRALFNVAVSNTDDHLRNHGLLLTPDGWALSPAFDMNPNPGGRHHVLALNEVDDIGDLGTVMAARTSYGVSDADADAALREVRQAVSHWRAEATLAGLSATECAAFASAFAAAERA